MMKKHLLAFAVAAVAAGSAFAQAGDTLAKIKSSGSMTLGVRESSGLGYTLGNGKYVGFHTEMSERIADDLQKQLGLAKLEVKYQPLTSQNRVPLVQNGTVDLECGSTTNNQSRQKDAAFKKAVDDSIVRQIKDGSLAKLYDKWFMQPIPPNNVKVGLPLSAATKDAWEHPNDKPMEAYEVK